MVVPIKELANIQLSSSVFSSKHFQMANLPSYMDMDIDSDTIRGRSTSLSKTNSREASVLLNASTTPYHERMEINNNLPDEDVQGPIDSSQLSYNNNVEVGYSVRKAGDNHPPRDSQHVQSEAPALKNTPKSQDESVSNNNNTNTCPSQNTINIQLPYDVNQATEQDSWDRNFHSISLQTLRTSRSLCIK